jgi:hypothetical protein
VRLLLISLMVFVFQGFAAEAPSTLTPPKVKYSKGKDVNFEELLIQGQLQRAEISVVTGDVSDGTDGLLRLRENFLDRVAVDAGEEVP